MKTDMEFTRMESPPEPITVFGFRAACRHCKGYVVMPRDPETMELVPDACWCALCGQRYEVNLYGESLKDFDRRQWEEKMQRESAH